MLPVLVASGQHMTTGCDELHSALLFGITDFLNFVYGPVFQKNIY
jgi:hypothetical protein